MPRTRVKICCMGSAADIRLAVAQGADALGFVGPMPSGAGVRTFADIAAMVPAVPPPVASVLLTSETTAAAILAAVRDAGCNTVQIVDHIDPKEYESLRRIRALRFLQVVHIEDRASVALARDYGRVADALLLDSGRPSLDVKELGGTGRVHDWSLSAEIVRTCGVPVFLAGGLDATNVADAIGQVRPYGVDVCSKLRSDDVLDAAKLVRFMVAVARYNKHCQEC